MAEAFGIVTGVLGLLPLCHDGIGMIRNIFDESRSLELAVGRLELQLDRYDEWREIWRNDDGERDLKFEAYAKSNPAAARIVLRQLALMSLALFDADALEFQYGIKPVHWPDRESKNLSRFRLKEGETLTLETQGVFLERCKLNMSFIKRCKFVFRKKESTWNGLVSLIKDYNESLVTCGPKFELERMKKGGFDNLKGMQLEELRRRAEAAAYEARHTPPGNENGGRYHEIELAAQFRVVVKHEKKGTTTKFTMQDFRLDPSYVISSSGSSTMALLFDYPVKKEHRVVLIEWVEDLQRNMERDATVKTIILATSKPGQLLLPTCYGMVEDPATRRLGLVLAPPKHIRSNLPPIMPSGAISQKRMPVSLLELLERRHPYCMHMLDLGTRFKLAKKLVDAVQLMHCVGWVHKNIRSNSILFFPAPNIPSRGPPGPSEAYPQPIGYDLPVFVGLGNARVDDIIVEDGDEYYGEIENESFGPGGLRIVPMRPLRRPIDVSLDYYQHPDKRWNPSIRYSIAHDIYSLGCVLLEIGMWKSLRELVEVEDEDFERVKRGYQAVTMKLDGMTGSIYGNVVRQCLAIKTSERTEAEVRELSKFCSDIAASLDQCWA